MRAIVLPRAGGKTESMLRWLVSHPTHVMVVMSARERDRLLRMFPKDATEMQRIVTIHEILDGRTRGRWSAPMYGIDEVDQVLAQVLRGSVEIVSFTGKVESSSDPVGPEFPKVSPDRTTMWQFLGDRVELRLRGQPQFLVGRWIELSAWSGTFHPDGDRPMALEYSSVLSCELAP